MDGLQFLAHIKAVDQELPVIMITGHGDIALAVTAIQSGAYDFLQKPVDEDVLLACLVRAVEKRQLVLENRRLSVSLGRAAPGPDPLLRPDRQPPGHAPPLRHHQGGGGGDRSGDDLRRDRHRQGAGGEGHPRDRQPLRPTLCRGEHGGDARRDDGIGTLRLCQRGLHRGHAAQDRQIRIRRRRHAFSR